MYVYAASISNFMCKVLFLGCLDLAISGALSGRYKRHRRILMCVFITTRSHSFIGLSVLLLPALCQCNIPTFFNIVVGLLFLISKVANVIAKGKFTLRDFYVQLQTMMRMGPMDKVCVCGNVWEYTEDTLFLSDYVSGTLHYDFML